MVRILYGKGAIEFDETIFGANVITSRIGELKATGCGREIVRAALERGVKVTGATAYFADADGRPGGIIMQQAVAVKPDDDPASLRRRILEDAEWKLLCEAIKLFCSGRLEFRGNRIIVKNAHP